MPMKIALSTTGRTTGIARAASLYAFKDGERLVVVGSVAGAADDPAWVGVTYQRRTKRTIPLFVLKPVEVA